MRFRLNGWQRIGVVVSIAWFIGGGFWGSGLIEEQDGAGVVAAYKSCLESNADWAPCQQAFQRDWPVTMKYHWAETATFALVPIPAVWLFVYGLIAIWRWIARGFRSPQKNAAATQKTGAKRVNAE